MWKLRLTRSTVCIILLLYPSLLPKIESYQLSSFFKLVIPNRRNYQQKHSSEKCTPEILVPPVSAATVGKEYLRCVKEQEATGGKRHPLLRKATEEVIKWYGYPVEMYNVTTDDGYILLLHRIPSSRPNPISVLLMHGLAGCSDIWTLNGKDQSLAFILSDLGYDVWLGNSRGSSYSLNHKILSHEDIIYWDFSWHESGIYDLPAFVQFIMEMNGGRGMHYVGHSQGSLILSIAASSYPASKIVNEKSILSSYHLAPAMYIGRAANPLRLLSTKLGTGMEWTDFQYFRGRIDSQSKLLRFFGGLNTVLGQLCSDTGLLCGPCMTLVYSFYGYDGPLQNYTNVPNILDKFPNIVPFKSLIHFAQSMKSCKFRQFDYGEEENRRRYGGNATPPDYELGKVKIISYFFYGEVDNWVGRKDAALTASFFPSKYLKEVIRVDHDYFNHGDFLIAKNVKELVYDKITERMRKYERRLISKRVQ